MQISITIAPIEWILQISWPSPEKRLREQYVNFSIRFLNKKRNDRVYNSFAFDLDIGFISVLLLDNTIFSSK